MSLTKTERLLVQRATDTDWTDELRKALASAVTARRGRVRRYADCGELADTLQQLADVDEVIENELTYTIGLMARYKAALSNIVSLSNEAAFHESWEESFAEAVDIAREALNS